MLSSIKLYLFPLMLSFGILEMLHFGGFWRCGISLPAMRTIFINDAHYLWQRSALSLKEVFCRVKYKGSYSNSENGCLYYIVKVGLSVVAESGRATK